MGEVFQKVGRDEKCTHEKEREGMERQEYEKPHSCSYSLDVKKKSHSGAHPTPLRLTIQVMQEKNSSRSVNSLFKF